MPDAFYGKMVLIIIYLIIIAMLPLLIDCLFNYTTRKTRKENIIKLAKEKSIKTKKPIIIFNTNTNGVVLTADKIENFQTNIIDAINDMADNSLF